MIGIHRTRYFVEILNIHVCTYYVCIHILYVQTFRTLINIACIKRRFSGISERRASYDGPGTYGKYFEVYVTAMSSRVVLHKRCSSSCIRCCSRSSRSLYAGIATHVYPCFCMQGRFLNNQSFHSTSSSLGREYPSLLVPSHGRYEITGSSPFIIIIMETYLSQ